MFSMKVVVVLFVAVFGGQAFACGGISYDRDAELKIIRDGLAEGRLTASDKQKVAELLDKASISPSSLSIRGVRMQSDQRGAALKILGRNRIPGKPLREYEAIDGALKSATVGENERKAAQASRANAEKLWAAGDYDKAFAELAQAITMLNLKMPAPARC